VTVARAQPRIVLHVGAPKTASTYLQRRLRADPEYLRGHRIYVPVLPAVAGMAGNAKLLATALSRRPSLSFQRAFPEMDVGALDPARLVAELLAGWRPDVESVVLSAENLRPNHACRLRDLLPVSAPCVVVLFVRRQDRWTDSYFSQLVKTNDINDDIGTFVARLCDTEGERLCCPDWTAHYEAWRDAFGSCEVVFYDEVCSDVFAAFVAAAGLEAVPDLLDIDHAQVSLDIHQLAYLLELERPIDFSDFVQHRSASTQASQQLGLQPARSLLSATDLARLRERFEASNRRLMRMLGRDDETTPLRIDATCASERYCDLRRLHSSGANARHRQLADAIYAEATGPRAGPRPS